jgi:hypothetical protein
MSLHAVFLDDNVQLISVILCSVFTTGGILSTREPHSPCASGGKRPDGGSLVSWRKVDAARAGTQPAQTHLPSPTYNQVQHASAFDGSGGREEKLRNILTSLLASTFVPVAIETSGVRDDQALELVTERGRRIASVTYETRSTTFLRQRISNAVQCDILGTINVSGDCCDGL